MSDDTLVHLGNDDGRGMIRSGDEDEGIALIETAVGLLESTSANLSAFSNEAFANSICREHMLDPK